MTNKSIQKILLIVALDDEAKPIIKKFNLHQNTDHFSHLPMKSYSGKYNTFEISLITNGEDPINRIQNIGTQPATLSTYLGISTFHPDCIINIGTAGGIAENGAKIGDIYASDLIYFFDRRMPLAGYYEYGLGGYPSLNVDAILEKIHLQKVTMCSGDSFDYNKMDYMNVLEKKCVAKEMEAAAVAWVCMLTKTPMLAIKGITDIVGKKTNLQQFEEFKHNLLTVTEKLAETLKTFLDHFNN